MSAPLNASVDTSELAGNKRMPPTAQPINEVILIASGGEATDSTQSEGKVSFSAPVYHSTC